MTEYGTEYGKQMLREARNLAKLAAKERNMSFGEEQAFYIGVLKGIEIATKVKTRL